MGYKNKLLFLVCIGLLCTIPAFSQKSLIKYDLLISSMDNKISVTSEDMISVLITENIITNTQFGITNIPAEQENGGEIWEQNTNSLAYRITYLGESPLERGTNILLYFRDTGLHIHDKNDMDITGDFSIQKIYGDVIASQFLSENSNVVHLYQGFLIEDELVPNNLSLIGAVLDGVKTGRSEEITLSEQLSDKEGHISMIEGSFEGRMELESCNICEILEEILFSDAWTIGGGTDGLDIGTLDLPDLEDCLCGDNDLLLLNHTSDYHVVVDATPCETVSSYTWYVYKDVTMSFDSVSGGISNVEALELDSCDVLVKLEIVCPDSCTYEREYFVPCGDCVADIVQVSIDSCLLEVELENCTGGTIELMDLDSNIIYSGVSPVQLTDSGTFELRVIGCPGCEDLIYEEYIEISGCGPCEVIPTLELDSINCLLIASAENCPLGEFTFISPSGIVSNNGSNNIQTVTESGIWKLVVENCLNCGFGDIDTVQLDVSVCPHPCQAEITGEDMICQGDSTVLKANVSNAIPPINYAWSNGSTTSSIVGYIGTYSVTISDNGMCSDTLVHSINAIPPPLYEIEVVNDCTIQIDTSANSSECITVLEFDGGTGWVDLPGLQLPLTVDTLGDWRVRVECECDTIVSNVVSTPDCYNCFLNVSISGTQFCEGESTTLVANTSGAYGPITYAWAGGQTTQQVGPVQAGIYSVTVTDSLGCTATDTYTATADSLPPISCEFQSNNDPWITESDCQYQFCIGAHASIRVQETGYSYSWSNQNTTQQIDFPNISLANAGTYSVTVTDANGCENTKSFTVDVAPCCEVEAEITGDTVICAGTTTTLTADSPTGYSPFDFLWSTGAITQSISDVTAGTYGVTITDAHNCSDSTNITVIEETCSPNIILDNCVLSLDDTTCVSSYAWSNGETTSSICVGNGDYSVTISYGNGCTYSDTITVTTCSCDNLTANINGVNEICEGESAILSVTVSGAVCDYTIQWSESNQNGNTISVSPLNTSTYYVTVTDGRGCEAIDSFTLVVNPAPTVSIQGNSTVCQGTTTQLEAIPSGGTPGYTYLWNTVPVQQQTATINVGGGNYSVTVSDAEGCTTVGSHSVTEVILPPDNPVITCKKPTDGDLAPINCPDPGYVPPCPDADLNAYYGTSGTGTWSTLIQPSNSQGTDAQGIFSLNDKKGNYTFEYTENNCSAQYTLDLKKRLKYERAQICEGSGTINFASNNNYFGNWLINNLGTLTITPDPNCTTGSAYPIPSFSSFNTNTVSPGIYGYKVTRSGITSNQQCEVCETYVEIELQDFKSAGGSVAPDLDCSHIQTNGLSVYTDQPSITGLDPGGIWSAGDCNGVNNNPTSAEPDPNTGYLVGTNIHGHYIFNYAHNNPDPCMDDCQEFEFYVAEPVNVNGLSINPTPPALPYCLDDDETYTGTLIIDNPHNLDYGLADADGYYMEIDWETGPNFLTGSSSTDPTVSFNPANLGVGTYHICADIHVYNTNTPAGFWCSGQQWCGNIEVADCCSCPANPITPAFSATGNVRGYNLGCVDFMVWGGCVCQDPLQTVYIDISGLSGSCSISNVSLNTIFSSGQPGELVLSSWDQNQIVLDEICSSVPTTGSDCSGYDPVHLVEVIVSFCDNSTQTFIVGIHNC